MFYLADTFRQRQEFTVTGVTVLEEQSDGSTRAIWILEGGQEGGQRLRYIPYGAKYPDLKESQRPLRLRRKRGTRCLCTPAQALREWMFLHFEWMRMGTLDKFPG